MVEGRWHSLVDKDGTGSLECRWWCAGRRRRIESPAIVSDTLLHEALTF
jgi:hypothetical protein